MIRNLFINLRLRIQYTADFFFKDKVEIGLFLLYWNWPDNQMTGIILNEINSIYILREIDLK